MTETLIHILAAFLLAGWIQGLLGFGFAVTTTLLLVSRMDFTLLVFLNLSMSVVTCLIAMCSGKNLRSIHKPKLLKLIASATAGLLIGLAMLEFSNTVLLKTITLLVILLASLLSLSKSRKIFAQGYMVWISGFFSGALTPSTGINGPLVALHLNAAFSDKEQTRNTMLSYLLLIMTFGVVGMSLQGELPAGTTNMLLRIILPSIAGYALGMWSFRLLSHRVFKLLVTSFLILFSLISFIYLIT